MTTAPDPAATAAALHSKMREHVKTTKRERTSAVSPAPPRPPALANGKGATPNPFTYPRNPVPAWELLKFAVGAFTVIPLKVFIILFLVPWAWVFCRLSISCGFDDSKPMSWSRRMVLQPVAYMTRFVLFLFGYYWVETTGKPCSTKEARILVCAPHSTVVDTLYLIYAFSCPSAISKAENKDYPLAGAFFRAIQAIAVDRASREAKDAALQLLKERTSNPNERHLMVFPEGTCTNRTSLITFKRGAFASGQPVQPIVLEHPHFFFDPTWSAAGPNRFILGLRLLCQVFNRMRVHFLPVYYPSEEEKADPELYARNVRQVMADKLGVPVTQHSYHDMFLAKEAKKLHVTANALPTEMYELEKLFNVTLADAKLLLKRYSAAFKSAGGGRIDGETFAKILRIPYSQPVRDLVDTIADEDGKLDFASLLVGVTLMGKALSKEETEEAVELVWESVAHGRDRVSRKEMAEALAKITAGGFTSAMVLKVFDKIMAGGSQQQQQQQGASEPRSGGSSSSSSSSKDDVDVVRFTQFLTKSPEVLFVLLDAMGSGGGKGAGAGAGAGADGEATLAVAASPRLSVLEDGA